MTASPSAQITGTAATGAALVNAPVTITDSAGVSPCVETSISTTDLGSYTCTLKSGELAPFFIVVTDPTGQKAPLVSIATQTPTAGTPLTVNATPLTTAIIAQLNNGDALGVVANRTFVAADLTAITTKVLAQLAPVLTAIGNPAGYNPFTTSITAATSANTGNTADQLLDMVKIGIDPTSGKLAFSTITDPTPVPLATSSTAGTTVAAPTASASDLGLATQIAAKTFANCFALPTAQRVLATDTTITAANGGSAVTNVATACQDIATNGINANASPAYLHNGYRAEQHFYSLLTSDAMTGAKFSVPEIMAFYPADVVNGQPNDRAVLNIRYIDNAGNPGNVITVAANLPTTATISRPSNWWLVGNQQPVDVAIKPVIREFQQLRTAGIGYFMSGMSITISTTGPHSTGLTAAQITGAGLPTNGLWYFKNPASLSPYMDDTTYRNANTPNAGTYTATCIDCPTYWFGKTVGLTGTAATTYGTNSTSLQWAQGASEGSFNGGTTGTRPVKGSIYTVKLYAGTTLTYTVKKTLLTDLIDPAAGYKLPWNSLGTSSLAALDMNNSTLNGPLNTLTLDWLQNPAAQQISSVAVSTTNLGSYSPSISVTKGLTSIVVTPPSGYQFTGLTGTATSTNGFRNLNFGYRMLDGSGKSAVFTY